VDDDLWRMDDDLWRMDDDLWKPLVGRVGKDRVYDAGRPPRGS
jgi:hypothetical protein